MAIEELVILTDLFNFCGVYNNLKVLKMLAKPYFMHNFIFCLKSNLNYYSCKSRRTPTGGSLNTFGVSQYNKKYHRTTWELLYEIYRDLNRFVWLKKTKSFIKIVLKSIATCPVPKNWLHQTFDLSQLNISTHYRYPKYQISFLKNYLKKNS